MWSNDLALGQTLKQHGARNGVLNGHGYVGVRWYESLPDMARGAKKAALASFAAFSVVRLVVICLVLLALETAPFVSLFLVTEPLLRALAAGGVLCAFLAQLIPSVSFGRPWWPALLIRVRAPAEALTPELREQLERQKPELLTLLIDETPYMPEGWTEASWAAELRRKADRCAEIRPEIADRYRRWAATFDFETDGLDAGDTKR